MRVAGAGPHHTHRTATMLESRTIMSKKKFVTDVDALLLEGQFVEPDRVELVWRGETWKLKPLSAIDPRLIANLDTVTGVCDAITDAVEEDNRDRFPLPRAVSLPDGRTELSVFLAAWAEASGENVDVDDEDADSAGK